MKNFEIPYNFDKNLIACLKNLQMDSDLIYCIYTCPYQEDYYSAAREPRVVLQLAQMTREEYIEHMEFINLHFPGKLQLLLQSNNEIMPLEKLQFYIDLGFTKFCTGNFEQAKLIKTINPEFEVVGSITMKITNEDLKQHLEYKDVFDGFVLSFDYAKNFSLLQDLPQDYFYILLVNCFCSKECDGTHHWFVDPLQYISGNFFCPNDKYSKNDLPVPWNKNILIRPQDLPLFHPYISTYKLQGREYATGTIIQHFMIYLSSFTNFWFNFSETEQPNIELYL